MPAGRSSDYSTASDTSVDFASAVTFLALAELEVLGRVAVMDDVITPPWSSWMRTTAIASPFVTETMVPGRWLRVENFMPPSRRSRPAWARARRPMNR
jgi:hypothetical protein